jgi:hypothetical protein
MAALKELDEKIAKQKKARADGKVCRSAPPARHVRHPQRCRWQDVEKADKAVEKARAKARGICEEYDAQRRRTQQAQEAYWLDALPRAMDEMQVARRELAPGASIGLLG